MLRRFVGVLASVTICVSMGVSLAQSDRAAAVETPAGGTFVPVTPARLVETTSGAQATKTLQVRGRTGIPSMAA